MKKTVLIPISILILLALFLIYSLSGREKTETVLIRNEMAEPVQEYGVSDSVGSEIPDGPEVKPPVKELEADKYPEESLLEMAFTSQAPLSDWDALHEDACEEASLMMLKLYTKKKLSISRSEAEREIQSLVEYEEKNGYEKSITLEELAKIAGDYYGILNPRIESDVTVEKLKSEIISGRPIIVPAAGKILPNPNFKNGGPNYHMLVVKGYDANGFITNDPGTRKGESFHYAFDDLIYAIHDWDEKNILNGRKAYLVFD